MVVVSGCVAGCGLKLPPGNAEGSSRPIVRQAASDEPVPQRHLTIQAVIVTDNNYPIKIPRSDVNGAPLEAAQETLTKLIEDRQDGLRRIERDLDEMSSRIKQAEERKRAATRELETARETAEESFEKERPKDTLRSADRSSRSELDELLAKRTQQQAADDRYKDLTAGLTHLEEKEKDAERQLNELKSQEQRLRSDLSSNSRIDPFDALKAIQGPKKRWTTDLDGIARVSLPAGQPWVLWASINHRWPNGKVEVYRWLVRAPETHDADKTFYLDNKNLFDGQLPQGLEAGPTR
jgi:hypothetical protein